MIRNSLVQHPVWPWLLLGLILAIGLVVASCGSGATPATPTPTKTPRPAGGQATAAIRPTETAQPQAAAPTAVAITAATTAPPGATAVAAKPTAAAPAATAIPPTVKPATALPAPSSGSGSLEVGVQAFLWWRPEVADRDLNLVKEGGFTWVKQYFAWQDIEGNSKGHLDWERADRIVEETNKRGIKLLVRIGMDPDKPFWAGNPPDNTQHFTDFVAQTAARYRGRIHAYQIWNEPNLAREWGTKRPDPAAYTRMLRSAYRAIKAADPNAIVVTAGMAPTTEDSNRAMPDLRFYQGMYDAMGGKSDGFFDMLGVHGAGYAVSPETDPQVVATTPKLHNNDPSPADLKRVYSFRRIEDVRELMVRNGDANKRVAVLEFGWTTDNRSDSPYYWHGAGAGIDEGKQGCYMVRALKYAKEKWQPWIGVMSMIYLPDVQWTKKDEQYYWSIIGPGYPDLFIRFAYGMVKDYLTKGVIQEHCFQFQ